MFRHFQTVAFPTMCLALMVNSAVAHSRKEATVPADGAVLTAPPEQVGMTFDMPLRVTLITLTDQDGVAHDLVRSDDMKPLVEFSAVPPVLSEGKYLIEWRGLAEDGHPMQGSFAFEIGQ